LQLPIGKEMVTTQEAPDRAGQKEGLEGLLGVPEGHHAALLSVRLPGGQECGGGAQALDYRGWCNYATDTRASQARLHLLSEHGVRRCLSLPGALSGEYLYYSAGLDWVGLACLWVGLT